MAPSTVPSQEALPHSSPDRPLLLRLYSCPHLVAVVRLFDDRELDTADAERALRPLYEQFGKDRVLAACEELLDDRRDGKVVVFRLKRDVRQLAVQILGPVQAPPSVPGGHRCQPKSKLSAPDSGRRMRSREFKRS